MHRRKVSKPSVTGTRRVTSIHTLPFPPPRHRLTLTRTCLQTTGQVESVESLDGGDVLVSFRSRAAAEQGFAKGAHIALVGPVQVAWYAGSATGTLVQAPSAAAPASASASTSALDSSSGPKDGAPMSMAIDDLGEDSHIPDAVETGGWGADDDGFGMM